MAAHPHQSSRQVEGTDAGTNRRHHADRSVLELALRQTAEPSWRPMSVTLTVVLLWSLAEGGDLGAG